MATPEDLIKRYSRDENFRAQVDRDIKSVISRGSPDVSALMTMAGKYGIKLSVADAAHFLTIARKKGII